MKLIITPLAVFFLHIISISGKRVMPIDNQIHDVNPNSLKKLIRHELDIASDQVVEIIAQHVIKLLEEGHDNGTSFIQESWKTAAKRITKSALMTTAKTITPTLAQIVAESIKPPATSEIVYNSLFKPVCEDIYKQITKKLNITPDNSIWEYNSEDEDEYEDEEDVEDDGEDGEDDEDEE